jgi:hypothetical protein
MRLIKINDQVQINADQIVSVNFLPDKLKTVIVCRDRVIVESDLNFKETIELING